MSEKKLIGITLIPKEMAEVDMSELAVMQVVRTEEGCYGFEEEKQIAYSAIKQALESKEEEAPSTIFFVIEINQQERKRRRRRKADENFI